MAFSIVFMMKNEKMQKQWIHLLGVLCRRCPSCSDQVHTFCHKRKGHRYYDVMALDWQIKRKNHYIWVFCGPTGTYGDYKIDHYSHLSRLLKFCILLSFSWDQCNRFHSICVTRNHANLSIYRKLLPELFFRNPP